MSSILELDQLKQMVKNPHIKHWHEVLDQLLNDYEINTPLRVAHFVAQKNIQQVFSHRRIGSTVCQPA